MQITIHSFSWARPPPHNERWMLHFHTAQHHTASMPEQHPAPSPANHSFPGSRPAMGSQQRPEILPRSKSNQVLPRGYVLTVKIVQTWSLSALQCLPVYSKSPANWAEQKVEPKFSWSQQEASSRSRSRMTQLQFTSKTQARSCSTAGSWATSTPGWGRAGAGVPTPSLQLLSTNLSK